MITDFPLRARFPLVIRWGRERGWLIVRDPFTGEWHEIRAADAPDGWRRIATAEGQKWRDDAKKW